MSTRATLPQRLGVRDPFLWAISIVVGLLLTGLSVARYLGYNAGMLDLGSMYQAIASLLRGEPLVLTSVNGQVSRLAGHVELIYLLVAPLLAVWPDPRTLLVVQAVLMVSGAFPAYGLALRRLESRFAARCAALIYLFYPVAQTAVLFDFHGDTLAMPLLLFALAALDRQAWRSYGLFIALALLCKVYVALPVALLGALLVLLGRNRRVGLLTFFAASCYGALAFFVIRGMFTRVAGAPPVSNNYVNHYFGNWAELATSVDQRLLSALVVLGPALFLAWRGAVWLAPALPIAAAALLSTGPGGAFDYRYHHYALLVPFFVVAIVEGAALVRERLPSRNWRADMGLATAIVLIFNVALVDTPLNPLFWVGLPGQGRDHAAYGATTRDRVKDRFLVAIPARVPVAASVFLAAHIAERDTLYLTRYPDDPGGERLPRLLPALDYVLADGLFDYRVLLDQGVSSGADYEVNEIGLLLRDPAWSLVAERDGLLLFQRAAPAARALPQSVVIEPAATGSGTAQFGPITLVRAGIEPLGERRYRANFAWALAAEPLPGRHLVAISRLRGTSDARMVHLPSYALQPPATWQTGQVVRETFEVLLPAELPPGTYTWEVAWYDLAHSEGHATDARSLLAGTAPFPVATVEIR